LDVLIKPAVIEPELSVRPAQFLEALLEGGGTRSRVRVVALNTHQHPNPPDPIRLLRSRNQRPRRGTS
jgi:hypothetical protein